MALRLPLISTASRNGSTEDDPVTWKEDDVPPQLSAAYKFHGVSAFLTQRRDAWMYAFFAACAVALLLCVGLVWSVRANEVAVVKIFVDDLGRARRAVVNEEMPPAEEQAQRTMLTSLIHDMRTVSTDLVVQMDLVDNARAHLRDDAWDKVDAYYREHDPRLLSHEMQRTVQVHAVLPVPRAESLYKVEWTETTTPVLSGGSLQHSATERQGWQAYLRIEQRAPTDADEARINPLGLYVTDLTWDTTTLSNNTDETSL